MQFVGHAGKRRVIARFTGLGQLQERREYAGAVQQGICHRLGQGHRFEGFFQRHVQHRVEQREHPHHEGVVAFFRGQQFGRQQLHQASAHHGGLAHGRRGSIA